MAKANQERRTDRQHTEEVMDLKSKHHLVQGGVEDRISQLPATLRCHILSLMPTLYAVRTTILSKSWNKLWISVPNLDFDQDDFISLAKERRAGNFFEKFSTFVDRVLSLHDSSNIRKFRIHCYLHVFERYVPRIRSWICAATTRYNTVELDLDIYVDNQTDLKLPKSVFTCKTLVVLRVRLHVSLCDPNLNLTSTSSLFPSLKCLHYTGYNPDNASLEKLLSNCHALEDLTIEGCTFEKDVYNFKISAPALKTLRILGHVYSNFHEYRFSIDAPKLESLVVRGYSYCLPNYCLVSAKSLTKARICIVCGIDLSSDDVDRARALLARVSGVEYLSLSTPTTIAGSLPQCFNNLKRLEMTLFSYCYWDYVVELLKRSPNLEDLVLNFDHDTWNEEKYVEGYEPFKPPEFVPVCVLSHLKTIFISDFMGYHDEFEVMKYLLKYGEVLEKITISTFRFFIFEARHITEDKFRKKCLKIQKLSKTCEVQVEFRPEKWGIYSMTVFECEKSSNVLIEDE